jgi:hypothetical protein
MTIRPFAILLLGCTLLLSPARAQTITGFSDVTVFTPRSWNWANFPNNLYGPTLAGPNLAGQPYNGSANYTFTLNGLNQISVTAAGNVFPAGGFVLRLGELDSNDSPRTWASAIFSNSAFGTPGATVTSPLVIAPGYESSPVTYWDISSTFVNTGTNVNASSGNITGVTFTNAAAGTGAAAAAGIGGKVITNFGTGASYAITNAGSYNATTSTFAPTTYGDQIGGTTTVGSFVGATQVSITASAQVPLGETGNFNYILTDAGGGQAFATFDWTQFNGGVQTVQSTLVPGIFFDPTQVVSWALVNMNEQAGISATLYGAAGLSPSQTDTVVDDFSVDVAEFQVSVSNALPAVSSALTVAGYANSLRQIENTITGFSNPNSQATVQVADGNYLLATTATENTDNTITYDGFSLYATEQHFLRFDFSSVQNLTQLEVEIGTASLGGVIGVFAVPDSEFASSSFFIDLSLHPNWEPAFAAGIDFLNVSFGAASGNTLVELDRIAFTSVPEPSTSAFLALGGALVVGRLVRKRRS